MRSLDPSREEEPIPNYGQIALIYNPVAGRLRRQPRRLERLQASLEKAGHGVVLSPTPGPAMAVETVREQIEQGADLVLAYGGDGTINEIAEGMIGSSVPFGVIPGGTANVLANEIGLPGSEEAAAAELSKFVPVRIPVGRVESASHSPRHFLLMAGVGLDAHIVYHMTAELKKRLGKLSYWLGGFRQVGRDLEEFDVEIEGRGYRASFALVTKVRNYGGDLEIARRVSLLDERFEIVLFEGRQSLRYLKYFAGVAFQWLHRMDGVTILRATRAAFRCPEPEAATRVYMQIDGEYAGRIPGSVCQVPDAVTLLIPEAYRRRSVGAV